MAPEVHAMWGRLRPLLSTAALPEKRIIFCAAAPQKDATMSIKDEYLTRKEVANTLGISTSTLRRLLESSDFPQPIKISERRQLFLYEEIFDWLYERHVDRMRAIHDGDTYDAHWVDEENGDEK